MVKHAGVQDPGRDADRQGEVQGVPGVRVEGHVQSHDLPAVEETHLENQ